jgi:hypothetical protein
VVSMRPRGAAVSARPSLAGGRAGPPAEVRDSTRTTISSEATATTPPQTTPSEGTGGKGSPAKPSRAERLAEPRSRGETEVARNGRRAPRGGRTGPTSPQRGLAPDREARAHRRPEGGGREAVRRRCG